MTNGTYVPMHAEAMKRLADKARKLERQKAEIFDIAARCMVAVENLHRVGIDVKTFLDEADDALQGKG